MQHIIAKDIKYVDVNLNPKTYMVDNELMSQTLCEYKYSIGNLINHRKSNKKSRILQSIKGNIIAPDFVLHKLLNMAQWKYYSSKS